MPLFEIFCVFSAFWSEHSANWFKLSTMTPLIERNLSIKFNNQEFSLLAIQHVDKYMVILFVTLPNSILHKTLAVLTSNPKFRDFFFSYLPDKTVLSNSLNRSTFSKKYDLFS